MERPPDSHESDAPKRKSSGSSADLSWLAVSLFLSSFPIGFRSSSSHHLGNDAVQRASQRALALHLHRYDGDLEGDDKQLLTTFGILVDTQVPISDHEETLWGRLVGAERGARRDVRSPRYLFSGAQRAMMQLDHGIPVYTPTCHGGFVEVVLDFCMYELLCADASRATAVVSRSPLEALRFALRRAGAVTDVTGVTVRARVVRESCVAAVQSIEGLQ